VVELELGHLYYFGPKHLFVIAQLLEQLLVYFKKVARVERDNKCALGAGEVNGPEPDFHGFMQGHCDKSEVEVRQFVKDLSHLADHSVLRHSNLERP